MESNTIVEVGSRRSKFLTYAVCFVATANAATQGYDSSMMTGLEILPSFADYFHINGHTEGLNVAIAWVGALLGVPFAGPFIDRYGRKIGLITTAIIAIVGAAIQGAAINEAMFCIGRVIIGFSIMLGSVAAPAYVAEVAHPEDRVLCTGIYGATWYVGSLVAAFVTFGSEYIDSTWSWRLPSLLQFLPSICCLVPMFFLPESPRFLVSRDRFDEAREVMIKYHGGGDPGSLTVAAEYEEIKQTIAFEKSTKTNSFSFLFATRGNRWRTFLAAAIAFFSQVSGNNIITYYLGDALDAAGVTTTSTQLAINVGLTAFNLIIAGFGSYNCDKVSRKLSLFYSALAMTGFLIIMTGLNGAYGDTPTAAVSAAEVTMIFLFYGCYSLVWTPVAVIYPTEVLSYSMRANGLCVYQFFAYGATFFNTYAIPHAMDWSSWGFYLITALWILLFECPTIWFLFPDTRGKTLEEIDVIFDGKRHADVDFSVREIVHGVDPDQVKGLKEINVVEVETK